MITALGSWLLYGGITFLLTIVGGVVLIPVIAKLKVGQTVRDDGPAAHLAKMGTPTMGGVIFLIPLLIVCIYYSFYNYHILGMLFVTLGFGTIGFIDDYIKVVKKRKDGLFAFQKMIGLLLIAIVYSIYVSNSNAGTDIIIPFVNSNITIDLGLLFIPFTILVLISVTNAVNITDGVDGLAAGVTCLIMIFFAFVALQNSMWSYVGVFCICVAAGCLSFLIFNWHPAKVFMGDAGALALGGAVGAVAIALKMPLVLVIVGLIYVVETLSVMIQVVYFKRTGKRIFKMAPLHHHFELSGWKEKKVVITFCFVTVFVCAIMFIVLKVNGI